MIHFGELPLEIILEIAKFMDKQGFLMFYVEVPKIRKLIGYLLFKNLQIDIQSKENFTKPANYLMENGSLVTKLDFKESKKFLTIEKSIKIESLTFLPNAFRLSSNFSNAQVGDSVNSH